MFTRERNGKVLRKSLRSGAHNDCVYLTSPDEVDAEIEDSKSEDSLRVSSSARACLVTLVASGALALGILVGDPGMTHDTVNWKPVAINCGCR